MNPKECSEQRPTVDTSKEGSCPELFAIMRDQNLVAYKATASNSTLKMKSAKLDTLNIAGNSFPRPSTPMRRPSTHQPTIRPRTHRHRPTLHREGKRTSNHYEVAQNIGLTVLSLNGERRINYKCFVLDCELMTRSKRSFKHHMKRLHKNLKWTGFCQACKGKKVNYERHLKVRDELKHLREAHMAVKKIDEEDQTQVETGDIEMPNEESGTVTAEDNGMTSMAEGEQLEQSEDENSLGDNSEVESSATLLRPWMDELNSKSEEIVRRMLQDDCLDASFKCMERACDFFTSDIKTFQQHVNVHFEDKRAEGHNQCSYCEFIVKDSLSLVEHVSINHWCKLQCKFCFFRCPMKVLARHHILQCHPELPRNSKFIRVTPSPYLSWANVEKMVSPLFCSLCDEKFYLVRGFKGHVNECVKNRRGIGNCVKCGVDVGKKEMFAHLESCYQVGMFHCLYCRFGTNGIEKLQSHIKSQHSGELQLYCIRQSTEFDVDPTCYKTMIIALMKSCHERKMRLRTEKGEQKSQKQL